MICRYLGGIFYVFTPAFVYCYCHIVEYKGLRPLANGLFLCRCVAEATNEPENKPVMNNAPIVVYQIEKGDLVELARQIALQIQQAEAKPTTDNDGKPVETAPRFYTRHEVAAILRVSLPTVQAMMADGRIKATRAGSRVLIYADDLEARIKSGEIGKYKRTSKK